MKVALITDGIFPLVLGGIQRHSFYLSKYLSKAKVHVDVYHYIPESERGKEINFFDEDEKEYVNLIEVNYPRSYHFPGHYLFERFLYSRNVFNELTREKTNYDFIYIQGFSGWEILRKRKCFGNTKIVLNFHGLEMFQRWPSFKEGLKLTSLKYPVIYLSKKADVIVSLGGKLNYILQEKIKVPVQKIREIPIGISQDWINPEPGKSLGMRRFVFIGRFERRKGIEELNDVIQKLLPKYDFEFHLIGPIPEEKKIGNTNIKYYGIVKETEKIKSLLREMDVLVCPSHSEGMPNVILEGMSSGLAIIATNVGATELLIQDNGWLITPDELKENLSKAITEGIEVDANTLLKMKLRSIEIIKRDFLWDKVIDKTLNQIVGAVGNKGVY